MNAVAYADQAFEEARLKSRSDEQLNEFKMTYKKKTLEKKLQQILRSIRTADKEEDADLEDTFGDRKDLLRLFYISKSVSKDLLKEATLQQEAAVAGLAPFVYGYDENPPNFALTMQVIPTAVDAEGMNKAYRRGPMSHRMQLAALAHELDQLKIHHNDFKPDNYRLDGNRLYLIDFGLSETFDYSSSSDRPTNVAAIKMGGYSYSARPGAFENAYFTNEQWSPEIIRRSDDLGDIEAYDHEKASMGLYEEGDKVLVDVEIPHREGLYVQYMLYECTGKNENKQDQILPPVVKKNTDPLPNSSYCHVEGNYYAYLDKAIMKRKIKRDINANDRPSWKALWVHSTIPYTMEECLAERQRVLEKEKMRKMFKDEFGQEMTTTSRGLQLKF